MTALLLSWNLLISNYYVIDKFDKSRKHTEQENYIRVSVALRDTQ